VDGVASSVNLALRFAGPLIQTGPTMMNWRALALNLKAFLPSWAAWGTAALGMIVVTVISLRGWLHHSQESGSRFFLLILATLAATFTLSWHSHFYMLILLIPILLLLDQQNMLPSSILAAWIFGPLGLYLLVILVQQNLARNMLGLAYLGVNLILWVWAIRRHSSEPVSPTHMERV
jgi:hypothetical protein